MNTPKDIDQRPGAPAEGAQENVRIPTVESYHALLGRLAVAEGRLDALLFIVQHLYDMFHVEGADRVYRDSIAIGDDDRTLNDYVIEAIKKAQGQ